MKNTLIISAYTCCGKTYASEHIKDYNILDVNIYDFKTIKRLPNEEEIEKERQWWESSLHLMSIDRFRAMSLEELSPYLVKKIYVGEIAYWYSPSGYIFENYDAAIENCIHWLDKEYHKEN